MKKSKKIKILRAVLTIELEDGRLHEVTLPDGTACSRFLEDLDEAYVDPLGGVGYGAGDNFQYILGELPPGWPAIDGRIQWCTAGPFEGTEPQLWAFRTDEALPSEEQRERGQDAEGLLASIFIENDGTFSVHVSVQFVKGMPCCTDDPLDHEISEIKFDSCEEAREAVTKLLNEHFDGKCELVDNEEVS